LAHRLGSFRRIDDHIVGLRSTVRLPLRAEPLGRFARASPANG